MTVSLQSVADLRAKYGEILSMRIEHESGTEDTGRARARMAALAARFPGALREVDRLQMAEIRERIQRLDSVLAGEGAVETWMVAVAQFHELTRAALRIKRSLSGEKRVEVGSPPPSTADALQWANELAHIASPPSGRLTGLVYARIGRALGTTDAEAQRLVFGPIGSLP